MDELERDEARLEEQSDRLSEHIDDAKDAAERAKERNEFPAGLENDPESGPEEGAGPNPAEQGEKD